MYSSHLGWIEGHIIEYHTPPNKREEKLLFFLMDKHVEHRKYFLAGYPGMYTRTIYFEESIPKCIKKNVIYRCSLLGQLDPQSHANSIEPQEIPDEERGEMTLSAQRYYNYRYNKVVNLD